MCVMVYYTTLHTSGDSCKHTHGSPHSQCVSCKYPEHQGSGPYLSTYHSMPTSTTRPAPPGAAVVPGVIQSRGAADVAEFREAVIRAADQGSLALGVLVAVANT